MILFRRWGTLAGTVNGTEEFCLITFGTTHHALRAEQVVGGSLSSAMLIPLPREISSDCGLALRFHQANLQEIKSKLKEAGVAITGIYYCRKIKGKLQVLSC